MDITDFTSVTLASILSALSANNPPESQAVISTYINPSISGQWELDLGADRTSESCREIYNFSSDNQMWAVSGKEWTYGKYVIIYETSGLPIIAINTLKDNNEVDCSGKQIDQTGDSIVAYVKYDKNNMQWCSDATGAKCFMEFKRILP